jgi:hypothetical protein
VFAFVTTCYADGAFYKASFELSFSTYTTFPNPNDAFWDDDDPFKHQDLILNAFWMQFPDYSHRYDALKTHEYMHIDDDYVTYQGIVQTLSDAEGETYCTSAQCEAYAHSLDVSTHSYLGEREKWSQATRN